jgi:hypothetical protein
MKPSDVRRLLRKTAAGLAFGLAASVALAQAQIVIVNADGPGEGFNDPTLVAPVGGNAGTTLGQQRLIAFQHAAGVWGAQLPAGPTISILANFDPLSCNANSAVLGSAGAVTVWSDFAGAQQPGTWYGAALANKLAGADLLPQSEDPVFFPEIVARFNSRLGQPNCLAGAPFYLGLDSQPPGNEIDLVAVLLHEFGHGLGFQTFTRNGVQLLGQPSIWDHFLFDNVQGLTWVQMTQDQRAASAVTPRNLVWDGKEVRQASARVLARGRPTLEVSRSGPGSGQRRPFMIGVASFGPPLEARPVRGDLALVVDQPNGTGLACAPLDAANTARVAGRVAIIDRGTCGFTVKVKNAQNAGAVAVVIVDNVPGGPPPDLGGVDSTITIPAVRVTLADGTAIKAQLATVLQPSHTPEARIFLDLGLLAGADERKRPFLYTPTAFAAGSSVSHWDTSATPNLLMEPFINAGLTQSVRAPQDLTLELLRDIGW